MLTFYFLLFIFLCAEGTNHGWIILIYLITEPWNKHTKLTLESFRKSGPYACQPQTALHVAQSRPLLFRRKAGYHWFITGNAILCSGCGECGARDPGNPVYIQTSASKNQLTLSFHVLISTLGRFVVCFFRSRGFSVRYCENAPQTTGKNKCRSHKKATLAKLAPMCCPTILHSIVSWFNLPKILCSYSRVVQRGKWLKQ